MKSIARSRPDTKKRRRPAAPQAFFWVVMQLIAIDLVFSLDSIITAIGMVRADRDHDRRGRDRDDRDVCGVRAGRRLHPAASDHQDAGACVPAADRHRAGRRRLRGSHSARLHLFRHGVRGVGRSRSTCSRAATGATAKTRPAGNDRKDPAGHRRQPRHRRGHRAARGAQGYAVAINYKSDEKAAASVVDAIAKSGGKAVAIQGDMGVESDVARVFETVDAKLGRLTHLVYNSGITGKNSRVEDVPTQVLREVMDINVMGAFWCARAAIPRISKSKGGAGGAIVLISSVAAEIGSAGRICLVCGVEGRDRQHDRRARARARRRRHSRQRGVARADRTDIHEPGRLERIGPTVPMKRPGTRGRDRAIGRVSSVRCVVLHHGRDPAGERRALAHARLASGPAAL